MQKTNTSTENKADIEALEAIKKRAARQAAKHELAPEVHPQVECTVLPMGDGKISMGEHVAGLGTAHYEDGETFTVTLPIAIGLYERGFVNFAGAKEAVAAVQAGRQRDSITDQANRAAYEKALALVS